MEWRIEHIDEKTLLGHHQKMSLVNNTTHILWRGFRLKSNLIQNRSDALYYSLQIYPENYFLQFNPNTEFTKWAAVEIENTKDIPEGMDVLTLPAGTYAVFKHIGPANLAPKSFNFILNVWLPNSEYEIDHRPQFELLGENYKADDLNAEEEIWMPIKNRT
jgi:AraC family transcriptional regulator